ncbi:MAG TPA: cation-binding protein [Bacteroidia bacterium]|nr:cation-binding protein [Bacteroidia bacterium]
MQNTNRIKSFDAPHKALRYGLSQLLIHAGKTDYTNRAEIDTLYNIGKDVFKMLTVHAHDENNVTLKHLESKAPGASHDNMADHEAIEARQLELENQLEKIYKGPVSATVPSEFYSSLSQYISNYLLHMHSEETDTQQMLWLHFTDEELIGHRMEIMGKMEPEMLKLWIKYIVPAQSFQENTGFMGGFKKMAPQPFFESVMAMLEKHLNTTEFQKLSAALAH